jgi:hypothetical protein
MVERLSVKTPKRDILNGLIAPYAKAAVKYLMNKYLKKMNDKTKSK